MKLCNLQLFYLSCCQQKTKFESIKFEIHEKLFAESNSRQTLCWEHFDLCWVDQTHDILLVPSSVSQHFAGPRSVWRTIHSNGLSQFIPACLFSYWHACTTKVRSISVVVSCVQLLSLPHQFFSMMTISLSMHRLTGTISEIECSIFNLVFVIIMTLWFLNAGLWVLITVPT
jgi:hypothetical protein